jgi:hypothetical protein
VIGVEARRRSIRLVTGVIASSGRRGKRSSQKRCEARGRKGSAARRHSSSESSVGSWKIVGAISAGRAGAIAASAWAAWVVTV